MIIELQPQFLLLSRIVWKSSFDPDSTSKMNASLKREYLYDSKQTTLLQVALTVSKLCKITDPFNDQDDLKCFPLTISKLNIENSMRFGSLLNDFKPPGGKGK